VFFFTFVNSKVVNLNLPKKKCWKNVHKVDLTVNRVFFETFGITTNIL